MEELNYEVIKSQIDTYYKEKIILERYINDDETKKAILFTIFGSLDSADEIKDFCISELLNGISILKYKTSNIEKNKELEIIAFIKMISLFLK